MNDNKSAYYSAEYDEEIRKSLPYYDEFHKQAIDSVRAAGLPRIKWLDTGCGTGKTALTAYSSLKDFDISFTLCDISEKMIEIAKKNLAGREITFRNIPSQELDYCEEFDIVTAIQCHHYLNKEERKAAVMKCYNALKRNGIFITFENIFFDDKNMDLMALKKWEGYMLSMGKTAEETKKHLERRNTEYFPITIPEHLCLLKDCGFKSAELLWLSNMQAGLIAKK